MQLALIANDNCSIHESVTDFSFPVSVGFIISTYLMHIMDSEILCKEGCLTWVIRAYFAVVR